MRTPFATPIDDSADTLAGPLRGPRQMLATQQYDSHTSIHDDATAQKLGFKGGAIEGPTHFSQFVPLCVALWGVRWLEAGCVSAHYRNPCFEGEQVRAFIAKPRDGETQTRIWMQRDDGTEILRGTASIGTDNPPSALQQRISEVQPPEALVILRDVRVGMRSARTRIRMGADQHMGDLYPFSLADKLEVIAENSPWYTAATAGESPWGRAIIPFEMISVLLNHATDSHMFPVHGPVVGLFADQEIRLIKGPLFVDEDYEIEREIIALSGSRRTESMWIRTSVMRPGCDEVLATMLLNSASLKDSYANYARDLAQLQG
ncbi:hypothetical protein [Povalibacter sp.]|uniref:hypothetical protein n=1 Tax=Povalibacter sp. TaxID=1962978 RepID=UPI002F3E5FFE